ncbi:unnamed protein product [Arabis nemorensis]|uniref:Late embryogenesis abundant protein LEA-2 subgroup domain-containing protein n=1 Tax=Arabis nemorensis TaxID=586526 RepID=A0A565AY86_9BRAS|nr:unnamed protein product [Arabis nemorensis]
MASKDCGSHHSDSSLRRKILRRIIYPIIAFLVIILFLILIIWAILQPSKPRFILQDATVFSFNVTGDPPNLLTSNFHVTISSRNPNDKIGIYYDRPDVYASYKSQQITFPTSIPPTYQGHKEVNVWSPFVGGNSVPVAPYNALCLEQDGGVMRVNMAVLCCLFESTVVFVGKSELLSPENIIFTLGVRRISTSGIVQPEF